MAREVAAYLGDVPTLARLRREGAIFTVDGSVEAIELRMVHPAQAYAGSACARIVSPYWYRPDDYTQVRVLAVRLAAELGRDWERWQLEGPALR